MPCSEAVGLSGEMGDGLRHALVKDCGFRGLGHWGDYPRGGIGRRCGSGSRALRSAGYTWIWPETSAWTTAWTRVVTPSRRFALSICLLIVPSPT